MCVCGESPATAVLAQHSGVTPPTPFSPLTSVVGLWRRLHVVGFAAAKSAVGPFFHINSSSSTSIHASIFSSLLCWPSRQARRRFRPALPSRTRRALQNSPDCNCPHFFILIKFKLVSFRHLWLAQLFIVSAHARRMRSELVRAKISILSVLPFDFS